MNEENYEHYLQSLRKALERKEGHAITSPGSFEALAEHCYGVSVSTIKRLFGYVGNRHKFTTRTLSALSRHAGYADWADFCNVQDLAETTDSDFISAQSIHSNELVKGDRIAVEWLPDRHMELLCLGNSNFKVVHAENCKLCEGDTFQSLFFAIGQPLYVSRLSHKDKTELTYVAGKAHGLTKVMKSKA